MTQNLPKHIADLCGIIDATMDRCHDATMPRKPAPQSPIATMENEDGTYTVTYFGREMGHMTLAKVADRDAQRWIAVTVHGNVKRCYSQNHARNWIIENSF